MLKPNEISDLTSAFEGIDVNKTGFIEVEEFKNAIWLKNQFASEEDITKLFTQLDTHKNNQINYSEFLAGAMKVQKHLNKAWIWTLFKNFDLDDSGFITVENLQNAFKHYNVNLTENDLKEIFKKHDKTLDSKISFQEFQQMLEEST